jgi:large subunit ribosomal protein L22
MIIKAEANNLRISPRKIRLVAKNLAGKNASAALISLRFVEKKSAAPLAKVLKSALSNATNNNKLEERKLVIKEIQTMEGPTLKRFQPRSRGMAHKIFKRTSHIRVILEEKK